MPQNYVLADAKEAVFVEADATKVTRRTPLNNVVAGTNWGAGQYQRARQLDAARPEANDALTRLR